MKFIKWWQKYFMLMADDADGGGGAAGDAADDASGSAAGSGDGGAAGGASGSAGAAAAGGAAAVASGEAAGKASTAKGSEGGYWPDDWRDTASKGDAKIAARLSRYASPEAVATALIAAQNRISSGELKPQLGKSASAEEVAAWRAEQGIPATHDKYDLDLGNGFVIGADDKPLVEKFLQAAHGSNQTPDQVKASLRAYYEVNEEITAQRAGNDRRIQEESTETLRADWGPDFRRNINLVHNLLDTTTSKELKESFLGGRLADGTPIGSSPEALKMLLGLALVNNPTATVVPGAGGGNQGEALDDAISKIEKVMRTNRAAYNKDEKMQSQYRDLLTARETMNKRKVA